jgi:hypothetical protein
MEPLKKRNKTSLFQAFCSKLYLGYSYYIDVHKINLREKDKLWESLFTTTDNPATNEPSPRCPSHPGLPDFFETIYQNGENVHQMTTK